MIYVGWLLAIIALGVWALGARGFMDEIREFLRNRPTRRP